MKLLNIERYRAETLVDLVRFQDDIVAAALEADLKLVVASDPDPQVVARGERRFQEAIADGRLDLSIGDAGEILPRVIERIEGRAVLRLGLKREHLHGEEPPASFEIARLEDLIEAAGGASARDHVIMIDGVRALTRLPSTTGAPAAIDRLIAAARRVNADYVVGFDKIGDEAVVVFSVENERDDHESLSGVLSDPEALSGAALAALAERGIALSELPNQLPHHHARLGEIALRDGRPAMASSHLARAAALAPKSARIQQMAAEAFLAARRFDELEFVARRLIALKPEQATGFRFLSLALEKNDRLTEALEAAQSAIARAGAQAAAFERHLKGLWRKMGQRAHAGANVKVNGFRPETAVSAVVAAGARAASHDDAGYEPQNGSLAGMLSGGPGITVEPASAPEKHGDSFDLGDDEIGPPARSAPYEPRNGEVNGAAHHRRHGLSEQSAVDAAIAELERDLQRTLDRRRDDDIDR